MSSNPITRYSCSSSTALIRALIPQASLRPSRRTCFSRPPSQADARRNLEPGVLAANSCLAKLEPPDPQHVISLSAVPSSYPKGLSATAYGHTVNHPCMYSFPTIVLSEIIPRSMIESWNRVVSPVNNVRRASSTNVRRMNHQACLGSTERNNHTHVRNGNDGVNNEIR